MTTDIEVDGVIVQQIFKQDSIQKKYQKKYVSIFLILTAIAITSIWVVDNETVDNAGLLAIVVLFFLGFFGAMSPTALYGRLNIHIGNRKYTKTVFIEKEEYDELKKLGLDE